MADSEFDSKLQDLILDIFQNDIEDRWKSISEIALKSKASPSDIFKVVNQSEKFVVTYNAANEPLITTREKFRSQQPFFKKLIGAFKNRIN